MQVRNVPDVMIDGRWVRTYRLDGIKYHTRASCLWGNIHTRTSTHPRYRGVENHFQDFNSFAEWCQTQYGYGFVDDNGELWHFDKDLLGFHYSPETCVFMPKAVNNLIKDLGDGVRFKGAGYYARDASFGVETHLGVFPSYEAARKAVSECKHKHLDSIITDPKYAKHTRMLEGIKQFKQGWKND